MRPGGGKEKGSEFERATAKKLSLWITDGHRADLFARNVLSGGQFTNQTKKGSIETGTPGDLMANHPLAFDFLSLFFIECKHYASLGYEQLLFDFEKSFLGKTLTSCRKQAMQAQPRVFPLLIAKQNMRPVMLVTDGNVGQCLIDATPSRRRVPRHHMLHSGSLMLMPLDGALAIVSAAAFIAQVKQLRNVAL